MTDLTPGVQKNSTNYYWWISSVTFTTGPTYDTMAGSKKYRLGLEERLGDLKEGFT